MLVVRLRCRAFAEAIAALVHLLQLFACSVLLARVSERFAASENLSRSAPVLLVVWNASDEALLAGLAAGDQDVARVLVHRFKGRVFGMVLSIIHDRSNAEDVAQEVFLRIWRHASSFDPRRGSAASWILTVARNAALDHVATRERRLDRILLDPLDAILDSATAPRGDETLPIADAVNALPRDQRETVIAAAYYGFTAREISEAWNVPLGTVKTRLRSALHKLRDVLVEATP
jgi:RNA polymerase sigma-70 factor (ECF subfamily)